MTGASPAAERQRRRRARMRAGMYLVPVLIERAVLGELIRRGTLAGADADKPGALAEAVRALLRKLAIEHAPVTRDSDFLRGGHVVAEDRDGRPQTR